MASDTQILLNGNKKEKVFFDLLIDGKKQTKRISTKMLKMDEKNQYRQVMTKPVLYGCMKKQEHPASLLEVNKILDKVSHEDETGHLFIADIKFHNKAPTTLLFNEVYPPVFKKTKRWSRLKGSLFN